MSVFPGKVLLRVVLLLAVLLPVGAQAALTVTPITWNIIGLDSNDVTTGPNNFPVGARVCSNVATTNVAVNFVWDSANPLIDLRAGSLSTINFPSIAAGTCQDAYFEVSVVRNAAAFDTTRRYHITATDFSGTVSTPTPREVYVEHLISQNRNSISDVKVGTTVLNAASVPPGGSMNLVVGNTYVIQLYGGTATQGYNQFEEFINFPNTIFQILDVDTTYSADNSPFVPNPNDKLYADACGWENDPNSPNYRSCVGGDFKAGGNSVVTTYTIRILGGGGTSQTLGSLLYDFSGSSFHYNSDYATSARIANIIDPTSANIAKSFNPSSVGVNGISALTLTLTNPNPGTLAGYNFVDNLPANLVVATPPAATTSGCGTPTLTANAGSSSISFSNGTLAANSNCVITVNVTPTSLGSKSNTTNNLFIDTINTGHNATAVLGVTNAPPPGTGLCNVSLARWTFPTGFTLASPAASSGTVSGTATATPGAGLSNPTVSSTNSTTTADGTLSWGSNGSITTGGALVTANDDYYEFGIDTTGVVSVTLSFDARFRGGQGPTGIAVFHGTAAKTAGATEGGAADFNNAAVLTAQNNWQTIGPLLVTSGLNPSGKTYFRIYSYNSGQTTNGQDSNIDNVVFTGCVTPVQPTIAKSFSPDPIAVNGVSTLTFTLTNTNPAALTGAAFMDPLPAGVQVAATPSAATTCGGTWAPGAGATSLTFSGGTIPASGSCTVSVNVTATTGGPHSNVSSPLSTTESGTNTGSLGTDTLTALLPPSIAKQFDPSPILAGSVSRLTFRITNPNQNDTLASVAFTDLLPSSPGQMVVAPLPNAAVSGCGSPSFAPAPGSTSLTFTGGSIAGGSICVVGVDVTVPVPGTYNNTSGNVSTVINGNTVNGNTAASTLVAEPPSPSISLLKQVSQSASGPWSAFIPVTSGPVFYRFTLENTGDVPLSPISIVDNTLDVSTCNAGFASATLPPPVAANENHIVTCVVGPFPTTPGSHTNTAHATGTFNATPVNSPDSSATYATTGLTLDKSVVQPTFLAAGNTLNYNYLVTNSGFAPLQGPVTVADDHTTVTCPAVTTVGDLDNFLDPGESITCTATYIVTASDVANAFVTNTATATVQGVNSNSDSATSVLATAADVSIVKTLTTAGPYTAGQTITYTLTVANGGPAAATSVQVTDTPTNLTITSVSSTSCAALPCTIPSLASGANEVITVQATINAPGAFDNAAAATAPQPDPNTTNNTDNNGNNGITGASADVSVTKTLNSTPPYFHGQTITYTLVVANAGPSTATNVQVADTPSNLSIVTVSSTNCSALPCTIPSLASGANEAITVTATINAPGPFDNSVNVMAAEADPVPGNNTDNSGNGGTADPLADVEVDKVLSTPPPYTVGQTTTYTITVTNLGPSAANSIDVNDTPSNLTITGVSSTSCSAFPCTIPVLGLNNSEVITVTATIDNPGLFNNSANAFADEPDPNVSNNTDNTGNSGNAGAQADVEISKTLDTAGPFTVGQVVNYTLVVTNHGPQPATNINVTDAPSNLSILVVSGDCTALPCTIANLAPTATATINFTATIVSTGAFDNTASANGAETDPNPSNNTDSTGNGGTAAASADVSIVKDLVTAGPYIPGQTVTYTLTVANAGPSTATNISVTDTPANLTITNVSGACTSFSPCTIASLAPNTNTAITVTATIDEEGSFDNAATANATEADPDPSNNTDNQGNGGTATISADVSVTKNLDTFGPYYRETSVTYTIIVANAGPSTATNVDVTDTPTNLTITSVTGACTSLPCTIASIASGANAVINVNATINATGPFDNAVTANADESDPNESNNSDTQGNGGEATAAADVSLTKILETVGTYNVGQSVTYTIVVSNAGPSTATSIQVTDSPSNLTITSVSGACTSLPCTIASIAPGANTNMTVTATITAVGVFDNSATAIPAETDPNLSNNTDNVDNGGTTGAAANISVVKSFVTPQPYRQADVITMNLQVSNIGPDTATNIQVKDAPIGLTVTNMTGGGCVNFVFNPSPFPGNGTCTIASLASGASVNVTVTAQIMNAGQFLNTATVTATEFDPITANNTSSVNAVATTSADLSITKTLNTAGPFVVGQSISYTLVALNAGPSPAVNVQLTDTPTNLTITSVTGGCTSLPCTLIPALLVNQPRTINVTATINAVGPFDNSATVTGPDFDPNPTNNTDNTGNGGIAVASADVSVVKTLTTAGPYSAGQSITYSLVIANAGPSTATAVQVTDTPTNLTITSVTGGGCAALPCTIPSIASGANVALTVTATINASGTFDNSATATAAENDPNPANNTDNTGNGSSTGLLSADVSVVKTLTTAGPYAAGQSITYSLVVANAGPNTATTVQVTDTPTNLTITSVTGGGCTALPCTIASIASGNSVTLTVTATITTPGIFDNSATATAAETDPNLTNNTDNTGNGGSTTPVAGIPTLDATALLALALLLAATGAFVVMKRS